MLPKTFEEENVLALSLQEQRIGKLSDIEPLKEALRYVMVLVGLRAQNFPNDAEKAVLIDFILTKYSGHTPSEIKLAFTMTLQGKLELEKGFDVTCYENFSVLYFSGIMNAYRAWAKEAVNYIPKKEQPSLPVPETSDAEFIDAVKNIYRKNRDYRTIPILAYKILESNLNLTRADKDRIYQYIHERTKEGNLQDLCKQYAVKEYFDKV